MKLYLKRYRIKEATTNGSLYSAAGIKICDTLEFTPCMLPQGTYRIIMRRHPKTKVRTPKVCTEKATFLEKDNGAYRLRSSISVGQYRRPGLLVKTRETHTELSQKINLTLKAKGTVELVIK